MIIFVGLVALVAAVIIGVAGVVANTGESHVLANDFTVFDYHFTDSSGLLFLVGIAVGAVGMCGLMLVATGSWLASRRSMAARRELRQSRREMAAVRKDLAVERKEVKAGQKDSVAAPSREPVWQRWTRKPGPVPTGNAPARKG